MEIFKIIKKKLFQLKKIVPVKENSYNNYVAENVDIRLDCVWYVAENVDNNYVSSL